MDIGIHVSFSILFSSGYMPSNGIAGSYGGFIPSFLRNIHTIVYSSCINLHSHQQCKQVPFTPRHLQHLFLIFLMMTILHFFNNERCWTSLHVLVSYLCVFSGQTSLFMSFPHFLIGLFVFLVLSCMSCLYILKINPLLVVSFAISFSHSEHCLFTFFAVSFAVQKLLGLIRSHFLFLFLFTSRRWVIKDLALIYVIEYSACVFL